MEIFIPSILALLGALGGSIIPIFMNQRHVERKTKQKRLEYALEMIVKAKTARDFLLFPANITKQFDIYLSNKNSKELRKKRFLNQVENYFEILDEARQAVGILSIYRLDALDPSWQTATRFADDLDRIHAELMRLTEKEKIMMPTAHPMSDFTTQEFHSHIRTSDNRRMQLPVRSPKRE
ncbi:hypothetical protein [Canibacter oris]|uniref:Uncharacterized protein n=1 Tax=Canibacter oris TaxID=1365628 RepID=A0A840DHZ0_9MICO|nr:hypothetical protein [Canibacter oris]MBB4071395.1 hypothetical protein [Canibacter oris]